MNVARNVHICPACVTCLLGGEIGAYMLARRLIDPMAGGVFGKITPDMRAQARMVGADPVELERMSVLLTWVGGGISTALVAFADGCSLEDDVDEHGYTHVLKGGSKLCHNTTAGAVMASVRLDETN